MPIQPTKHIWHNGKLIPWEQAQIHVMSHVVHYGSSVFEGIRCYSTEKGAGIFRLQDHMQRMLDSAKIYRMDLRYTLDQLNDAVVETVESNGVAPCYIRPIACRGYGELGVNPTKNPIEVYIGNFAWGKYVTGRSRRGCLHLFLEPHGAQYAARTGEGRRELYELATDPHGGEDERVRRRHRTRCEWASVRRLRRKSLRRAQGPASHLVSRQLGS